MENILITPTINNSGLEAKTFLKESNVPFTEIFDENITSPKLISSKGIVYHPKGINEIKDYVNLFYNPTD